MPRTNLLVFRDSRRLSSLRDLCSALIGLLERNTDGLPLDALIAAGQLESSLADSNSKLTTAAESITDALARACVGAGTLDINPLRNSLETLAKQSENALEVSDPEGFSFYSLHPLDFGDAMRPFRHYEQVAIVGIRSIGTTLSAVASSALSRLGVRASRITVRPCGHPYDRCTDFTTAQKAWIAEHGRGNTHLLIVDEGPGLSGSSFLSVADSLVRQGVAPSRITLLGTHAVAPDKLCTRNAAERWSQYNSSVVSSRIAARHSDLVFIGAGRWREVFLARTAEWPASWTEMESSKFLSGDSTGLLKFEGLGPSGAGIRRRATALSDAGFGPVYEDSNEGVCRYELVRGKPLRVVDLSREVLERMADYCSLRAKILPADNVCSTELEKMLAFNYAQDTGNLLDLDKLNLRWEQPVITDSRMQPHEWLLRDDGAIIKTDGNRHGDDHFFPGPTDILWDLAGAIVEWDMRQSAAEYLAEQFQKQTRRNVSAQLPSFVLAYSCFRMAYSKMAMHSVADGQERLRFETEYKSYRRMMIQTAEQIHALSGLARSSPS